MEQKIKDMEARIKELDLPKRRIEWIKKQNDPIELLIAGGGLGLAAAVYVVGLACFLTRTQELSPPEFLGYGLIGIKAGYEFARRLTENGNERRLNEKESQFLKENPGRSKTEAFEYATTPP